MFLTICLIIFLILVRIALNKELGETKNFIDESTKRKLLILAFLIGFFYAFI